MTRRTAALVCIAVVVFAAFLPAVAAALGAAVLVPSGFAFSFAGVTVLRRLAARCDEQSVALVSLVAFRAPPALA